MDKFESFQSMFKAVTETVPGSWGPRRDQPEWDRDFQGNADIKFQFANRTVSAHEWLAFALRFSDTLVGGFEGMEGVVKFGRETAIAYVPKGKNQGLDA